MTQLGFDALLADAESDNHKRQLEQRTGYMPDSFDDAIPFLINLIEQHHRAMLAVDVESVTQLRQQARDLAIRLNGGSIGICGGSPSICKRLEQATAAAPQAVPLWGQTGSFIIDACGVPVRIELNGLYCFTASVTYWTGFAAHLVDPSQRFISPTGYRSFLGVVAEPMPDLTPDVFCRQVIEAHVQQELNGRLPKVKKRP